MATPGKAGTLGGDRTLLRRWPPSVREFVANVIAVTSLSRGIRHNHRDEMGDGHAQDFRILSLGVRTGDRRDGDCGRHDGAIGDGGR